jgi:hypothetical protein
MIERQRRPGRPCRLGPTNEANYAGTVGLILMRNIARKSVMSYAACATRLPYRVRWR